MTDGDIARTCPRCDEPLEAASSRGRVSFGSEIRVPVTCPACAAPLDLVVQPGIPDEVEVISVWAEDKCAPGGDPKGRSDDP